MQRENRSILAVVVSLVVAALVAQGLASFRTWSCQTPDPITLPFDQSPQGE